MATLSCNDQLNILNAFFGEPRAVGIQGKFVVVLILNSLQFCCEKYVCV